MRNARAGMLVAVAATILLSGCQGASGKSAWDKKFERDYNAWLERWEKDKTDMNDRSKKIIVHLKTVAKTSPTDCQEEAWQSALESVKTMELITSYRWLLVQSGTPSDRAKRGTNLRIHRSYAEDTITARFDIADTALNLGCLDIADTNYRQVFKVYTGRAYTAHRERAKIGIDDVRQKRN